MKSSVSQKRKKRFTLIELLDQMFALSNSMVISRADIIDTYVYRVGMEEAKFSLATAAGLFKSAIGLVLVLTTNAIAKRVDPDSAIM